MRVGVTNEAILAGPDVKWNHVDGPLMIWAGHGHWLTWRERFALWIGRATVDEIGCRKWPHLAVLRMKLERRP